MKEIRLLGRRWFQRTYGNTYHSVEIWIDGEQVHKVDKSYGYDSQYLESAKKWLDKEGYLPTLEHYNYGGSESLWRYCLRNNICFINQVFDVEREKDL